MWWASFVRTVVEWLGGMFVFGWCVWYGFNTDDAALRPLYFAAAIVVGEVVPVCARRQIDALEAKLKEPR